MILILVIQLNTTASTKNSDIGIRQRKPIIDGHLQKNHFIR